MKVLVLNRRGIVMPVFMLFMFLFSFIHDTSAQVNVDPAEFKGNGVDINSLTFNSSSEVSDILLYNVGKDMFLNAGGFWGTRTTTFTVGLPLRLIKNETKDNNGNITKVTYNIRGPFNNTGADGSSDGVGNLLGAVQTASTDPGVYFDRNAEKSGVNWTFELYSSEKKENGEIDYIYKVWAKKADNQITGKNSGYSLTEDYMLVGNNKMEIEVFNPKEMTNNNLVKALKTTEVTEGNKKYSLWKIVTTKQMTDDFATTYDRKNPSDATFLLRAQNFNRMNMYNEVTEGKGWHKNEDKGSTFKYSCTFDGVKGYDNNNRYGMFYCGSITEGKEGEKLWQKVEIPKSGWYRIDCQGFFYNSADPNKCIARLYAKVDGTTLNSASNAYVDLLPKSYGEPYNGKELVVDDTNKAFIQADGFVSNKVEAGIVFYNQLYPNSILIYVNFNEETDKKPQIELGLMLTANMKSEDYVYFDDFQLKYLGESFALDEGKGSLREAGDDKTVYKNRVMILKRSLKAGMWNGLTLPVNLTKQQLNTAFFPNPRIAVLTDMSSPLTISFKLIDLTKKGDDDIVVEAGKNYIINPGYEGRQGDVEIGDSKTNVITGPYYTIDRVSFKPSDVTEDEAARHTGDAEGPFTHAQCDCKLQLYGCYQRQNAPATAYMLYGGDMYHLTSPYRMKGFDCWIEDEHQVENPKARHKMGFSTYLDGVSDGETTDIYEALTGMTDNEDGTIYNMQGQMVGGNGMQAAQLPKGIYVRNGRKFIVR